MTTDAPILPRFLHAPYATERRVPLYPPMGWPIEVGQPPSLTKIVVAIYAPMRVVKDGRGLYEFEYQGVVVLP